MEAREQITKQIALQLQAALTAWNELYPDDSDADACRRSMEIIEQELKGLQTKPEDRPPPPVSEPSSPPPSESLPSTFRDLLIEIAREFEGNFDIGVAMEKAQLRGWSHHNPRTYVAVVASQLAASGILVRKDRGTYTLAPGLRTLRKNL